MKKSVKYLSDTKVELTVTVEPKELKDAEQVALVHEARDMKVDGFRKGKVPVSVAAKHVRPDKLAEHTLDHAISKAVADAFMDSELQALDRPEVDVKKFVPGEELEFTATAEIMPKVKLGEYKKLDVKKADVKVTEKDVNEIIDRVKKGFAEKNPVDRAAKMGDEVKIDFVGKKDGVPFDGGAAEGYDIVLGSGSFIPGFEEGIVGKKPGEKFDIDLTFPDNYHVADLKGAPVVFTVTLNEVKEVVEPELTDELAQKAGPFKTVKDLKDDIKREITTQKEREADERYKDDIVKKIVETSEIPVPEVLLSDQQASIERDMQQNLMYQGVTVDMYLADKGFKDREDWIEREVKPAAEARVKAGLALAEISKVEKVEATDQELLQRMNQLGTQYPDEKTREQLKTPEAQRDLANRILTEKTIDLLVDYNKKQYYS